MINIETLVRERREEFRRRFWEEYTNKNRASLSWESLLGFMDETTSLAFRAGLERAKEIANDSKATFFVNSSYVPDERVDHAVDEALYELKAETVTNIELEIMKLSSLTLEETK